MVKRLGTETSPSSGSSSPTTMRKSVVFPAPLGPTRPTFSPGLSWNDASTKTSCLPYCLLILEKEIIQFQANRILRGCVTASTDCGTSQMAKEMQELFTASGAKNAKAHQSQGMLGPRFHPRPIHPKLLLFHP